MMLAGTALVVGLMLIVTAAEGGLGFAEPRWTAMSQPAEQVEPVSVEQRPVAVVRPHGLVRFTVRTRGTHVAVRRTDVHGGAEQAVTAKSMRLPVGHWVATASAPGFRNWTAYFSVKTSGPTNLMVRLKPALRAAARRRAMDSKRHGRRRHLA